MQVWKYPLPLTDRPSINMPVGTEVLSVGVQHGRPVVWARVDERQRLTPRSFTLRGTGHAFDGSEGRFIGTFQLEDGDLIYHLFEARLSETLSP